MLELEFGYEHDWLAGAVRGNGLGGLLKFPATCNLELRWSPNTFVSQDNQRGVGDNWIGAQYRFRRQTAHVPTFSCGYALKIPSASALRAWAPGAYDQQFKVLISKDLLGTHFDVNGSALLIGRPLARGYDHSGSSPLRFHTACGENWA